MIAIEYRVNALSELCHDTRHHPFFSFFERKIAADIGTPRYCMAQVGSTRRAAQPRSRLFKDVVLASMRDNTG
jgi:hypothetical protein